MSSYEKVLTDSKNDEEEKSNKNEKDEDEKWKSNQEPILLAHLDFYSTAAMTYAQVFIACIFGLFTMLSLYISKSDIDVLPFIFLSVAFIGLYLGGAYCLFNFYHFWNTAFIVRNRIIKYDYETEQENKMKQKKYLGKTWSLFYWIKNNHVTKFAILVYFLILLLWIVILFNHFGYSFFLFSSVVIFVCFSVTACLIDSLCVVCVY